MAMRSRGGSAGTPRRAPPRSGVVRPVYEDFRPKSEWRQDDENHILSINLPGFMKEQIKVSTEDRNTIRVRGDRLVAGNKWSRFLEDFQVPDNGEMNSIQAKFEGGILNIKVPKKEVDKKPQEGLPTIPKSIDVQKQPDPIKGQDKVLTQVSTSQRTDEKSSEPKETSSVDSRTIKGQDGDQKQPTIEESLQPQKGSSDRRNEHDHKGGDQRVVESKEKHIASEKPDDVTRKTGPDEVETGKKATMEKDEAMHEKKADHKKEGYGAMIAKEKYKKAVVKGLAELNEERQLLVNMGVALLVIVALTAHITFKFATGKDK